MSAGPLTKAEVRSLWSAVNDKSLLIGQMPNVGCTPEQIAHERGKLATAKRALAKVRELRKQGL